jgi:glycosyltransferase involved in cell wall biosynthesis
MKFAYFGHPHVGGTHTVYTALRAGLAARGVEVRWLGIGREAVAAARDPLWAEELSFGDTVGLEGGTDAQQAEAMIEHLLTQGFSGVFVNVLANRVQMNAVRYLPAALRRIMIVHNITPGTYAAAKALRGHVHAAVGVSPRVRDDLAGRLGFPPAITRAIPNGVDTTAFTQLSPGAPERFGPLRLLFLGRIEDASKGVFWLPDIMQALPPSLATLTVAGSGPDLDRLRSACAGLEDRVRFIGFVAPAAVPKLLATHDVLVFPSRYEGLGLSLVEAMAVGCVPVASRIRGVTDFVVADGETGLLFSVGDTCAAADAIRVLAKDRNRLERLSGAARAAGCSSFSLSGMADGYAAVIDEVMTRPASIVAPEPLTEWRYPRGMRSGLRTKLPTPVKNLVRTLQERWRA